MTTPPRTSPVPDAVDDPSIEVSSTGELRSFRAYTYWSLVTVSAMLLVLFSTSAAVPYPPHPLGLLSLAGVVIVLAATVRLAEQQIPRHAGQRPLSPRATLVWTVLGSVSAVVVAVLWAAHGEVWLWSLAPAIVGSLVVADLRQDRRRTAIPVALVAAAVAGVVLGVVIGDDPVAAFAMGGVVVTGFWLFMTLATVWTWTVVVQLDEARRTAAALAVANERLRFAADLHDIQGHSLQVIAFKSELAGRLVGRAPSTAAAEMTAVQQLAVDALRDTRSVVEGYRRTSLDAEIANATNVLESAGIDARLHRDDRFDVSTLPTELRHLLGLVVRETVTNVLRHSSAVHAELTLHPDLDGRRLRLSVGNDGVDHDPSAPGGGLDQLAGRLDAAGGRLTWGRDGDRFEVVATVPALAPPSTSGAGNAGGAA